MHQISSDLRHNIIKRDTVFILSNIAYLLFDDNVVSIVWQIGFINLAHTWKALYHISALWL